MNLINSCKADPIQTSTSGFLYNKTKYQKNKFSWI